MNGTIRSISGEIGGIVGSGSNISNSSSHVSIIIDDSTGSRGSIGGLVGTARGDISSSYSKADIDFININVANYCDIGGFCGSVYRKLDGTNINDSYSVGTIKGDFSGNIGGFTGYIYSGYQNINIQNSYSAISILSSNHHSDLHIGGFAGFVYDHADYYTVNFLNCFWDKTITNIQSNIGGYNDEGSKQESGITPLTSTQMLQQDSFKGWDFNNVWKINEGKNYPELRGIANNQINVPTKPDPIEPDPVTPTPTEPTPVQPSNPEPSQPSPSNPNPSTPSNPTPSRPTQSNPLTPNNPQTPSSSNTGSSSESRPTIYYTKDNGNVYVYKDNAYNGSTGNNYNNSAIIPVGDELVEIEDGKTYVTGGSLEVSRIPDTNVQKEQEPSSNNSPGYTNSGNKNGAISYDTFLGEMELFINEQLGKIGKDFLVDLAAQKEADEKAIKAIKSKIGALPEAPDKAYEAFAKFIYEAQENSDIKKYSNKLDEIFWQIIQSLVAANKSMKTKFTIDGVEYNIKADTAGGLGRGMSFATVTWKNPKTGQDELSTLYFISTPEETLKTINAYQTALANAAKEEIREAIAYFAEDLTGISHKKARECVDVGEKLFNAMIDPKKGKQLGIEMGEHIASKVKGGILGFGAKKFDELIVENTANGGHIKELVDKLKDVQNAFNKVKEGYNKVADTIDTVKGEYQQVQNLVNSANNQNLLEAVTAMHDFSQYNSGNFNTIKRYLTQDI